MEEQCPDCKGGHRVHRKGARTKGCPCCVTYKMSEPGFLGQSQNDWCSLCPKCVSSPSGDSPRRVPIVDDSIGSSAVALAAGPSVGSAVDEDVVAEFMSYEQKKAEAMRHFGTEHQSADLWGNSATFKIYWYR